jgi:hypothetical protein
MQVAESVANFSATYFFQGEESFWVRQVRSWRQAFIGWLIKASHPQPVATFLPTFLANRNWGTVFGDTG